MLFKVVDFFNEHNFQTGILGLHVALVLVLILIHEQRVYLVHKNYILYEQIIQHGHIFQQNLSFEFLVAFSMKEPKTIDDYKQLLKAFKLKILKQKMKIQELQETNEGLQNQIQSIKVNNQNQTPTQPKEQQSKNILQQHNQLYKPSLLHDIDTNTMEGKVKIMHAFKQGASGFGVTLESIFRVADFQYKNQIQSDYFRNVLSKMKLGLSPKHISCLIYIFDENCTGFITRGDYQDSLHAYQVAMEQTSLHYKQECLLKLASLFHEQKINLGKFFDEMANKSKKSVNIDAFEKKIKHTFGTKILERQIVGSFNEIDLQSDQIIDRQNFQYSITAFINRFVSHSQERKPDNFQEMFQSHQTPFHNLQHAKPPHNNSQPRLAQQNNQNLQSLLVPNIQNYQPNQPPPQQMNNSQININLVSLLDAKIPVNTLNSNDILQKLNSEFQITPGQIIEEVCRFSLKNRLTIFNFKKALLMLRVTRQNLPMELINSLYRVIDLNHKGSIYFAQLLNFSLEFSNDISLIFRLLGKYFACNDLSGQKFWFLYGVNADHDISKDRFIEIMNKSFNNQVNNWSKLWAYFDKGKGVVPVASIIKEMSKYELQ